MESKNRQDEDCHDSLKSIILRLTGIYFCVLSAALVYWRTYSNGQRLRDDALHVVMHNADFGSHAKAHDNVHSFRFPIVRFHNARCSFKRHESADYPTDACSFLSPSHPSCIGDYDGIRPTLLHSPSVVVGTHQLVNPPTHKLINSNYQCV